tara:strand:- start:111 stop:1454 length:1344 start_codon:yes stop_codon:yes gene_type:complete
MKLKFYIPLLIVAILSIFLIITIAYKAINYINYQTNAFNERLLAIEHNLKVINQKTNAAILNIQNLSSEKIKEININSSQFEFFVDENTSLNEFTLMNEEKYPITLKNLVINDRALPYSQSDLVKLILKDKYIKTKEDEVIELFNFVRNKVQWDYPLNLTEEVSEPLKLLYVYGYGLCDDKASALVNLAGEIGVPGRLIELGPPGYHVIAELFYDGEWHLFDPDGGAYYQKNGKVLSLNAIKEDLSVLDRFDGNDLIYENRYSKKLIKGQIEAEENILDITDQFRFPSEHNLKIELKPGMSLSINKNLNPNLASRGYRNRLPQEAYLAKWSQEIFVDKKNDDLILESSFPYLYFEANLKGRRIVYSINDELPIVHNVNSGKVKLLFDEKPVYKLKIYTKRSSSILSYDLYSQINSRLFPSLERGKNIIKFDDVNQPINLSLILSNKL